jgi:hypothetical protein
MLRHGHHIVTVQQAGDPTTPTNAIGHTDHQVLYFQLVIYCKIYFAKYFWLVLLFVYSFLHCNMTADRNKIRLLHRAQSPRSGLACCIEDLIYSGARPSTALLG